MADNKSLAIPDRASWDFCLQIMNNIFPENSISFVAWFRMEYVTHNYVHHHLIKTGLHIFLKIPYSAKFPQSLNSQISREFSIIRENENFDAHFHCSACRSISGQHPRAKLPNPQGTFSKEIVSLLCWQLQARAEYRRQCVLDMTVEWLRTRVG